MNVLPDVIYAILAYLLACKVAGLIAANVKDKRAKQHAAPPRQPKGSRQ